MKTNLALILVTLMTLMVVGISSAQTLPKSSSKSTLNGDMPFVAEPITLETPHDVEFIHSLATQARGKRKSQIMPCDNQPLSFRHI